MREGTFIRRNIDRWHTYESPTTDPDELAARFTNLVDDLGYAKTFYPQSATVQYVNGQAANIFLSIYKNRKQKGHRLITFWTTEVPLIMYRSRKTLLFAFLFCLSFFAIGVFSSVYDPTFISDILGDRYVAMTEENIAAGKPFGVYEDDAPLGMFVYIAYHNILVDLRTFVMGIFLSVGSLYMLYQNGLMVGAFEQLFYKHGLGTEFFLTVFIHGTLELSALVIGGAAGLRVGNSILFPGTYTRLQSLKRGAKDGIKIFLSLIPVSIVASFFETYVTKHTEMPMVMSLAIIVGSGAFIVWYYVLYPLIVARRIARESAGSPIPDGFDEE